MISLNGDGTRYSKLEDDGGPEVYAVEEPDRKGRAQSLHVRVGMVFHGNEKDDEPGIWIAYQSNHMTSPLAGPVLLDEGTWRELDAAVRARLRRSRAWRRAASFIWHALAREY